MGLIGIVEIKLLTASKSGMAEFYPPQSSHETMLVQVAPHATDDMFVHRHQTDQLLVARGSFVLVILQNRQYQYIALSEHQPKVVKIPPGIPHAAINFSNQPCLVVNAVLRHGPSHERDYRPRRQPFPYDLHAARAVLMDAIYPATA